MNDKLDALIHSEMQQRGIPGLNVMVRQHGKVLEQCSYGFANLEHGVTVKPETVFQIGSIGKQFAATAVMLLVEAGKIELEAPISTYFSGVQEFWSEVKVQHLLTHTAGVPSDFEGVDLRADLSEDELLQKILAGTLEFKPGEQYSYSNDGYKLVGILVSKVTGMFYGDFLQQLTSLCVEQSYGKLCLSLPLEPSSLLTSLTPQGRTANSGRLEVLKVRRNSI